MSEAGKNSKCNSVEIIMIQECNRNVNGVPHCPTLDMKSKPAWRIYRAPFSHRQRDMTRHTCAQTQTHTHSSSQTSCNYSLHVPAFFGYILVMLCVCSSGR